MSEPNLDRWAKHVVESSKGNVWSGLGLTFLLHLLQVPSFFILGMIPGIGVSAFLPLAYVGMSQLVYMVPAILIAHRRGDDETAKGLAIGVWITLFLNTACRSLPNLPILDQ